MDHLTTQRLEFLALANEIRETRAADKKLIARGQLDASTVLRTLPEHWESAKVIDLLVSIHRVGRVKAQRWCMYSRVSLHQKLDALTDRQRNMLAEHIDIWTSNRDRLRRQFEDAA